MLQHHQHYTTTTTNQHTIKPPAPTIGMRLRDPPVTETFYSAITESTDVWINFHALLVVPLWTPPQPKPNDDTTVSDALPRESCEFYSHDSHCNWQHGAPSQARDRFRAFWSRTWRPLRTCTTTHAQFSGQTNTPESLLLGRDEKKTRTNLATIVTRRTVYDDWIWSEKHAS